MTCAGIQAAEQQMEDVYRVAPVPEEYMKYQLHLNTGLEMDQIDQWFKDRHGRQSTIPEKKSEWTRAPMLQCFLLFIPNHTPDPIVDYLVFVTPLSPGIQGPIIGA